MKRYLILSEFRPMNREEQKRINHLATHALKQRRSKDEILQTLKNAGIVNKAGKLNPPYNQVLVKK